MLFTEDEENYPGIKRFEYDPEAAEIVIRFVYDIPEDKKKKYAEENYAATRPSRNWRPDWHLRQMAKQLSSIRSSCPALRPANCASGGSWNALSERKRMCTPLIILNA